MSLPFAQYEVPASNAKRFRCLKAPLIKKDDDLVARVASCSSAKSTETCKRPENALILSIDDSSGSEHDGTCEKKHCKLALKDEMMQKSSALTRDQDNICTPAPTKSEGSVEFSGQVVVADTSLSWAVVKPSTIAVSSAVGRAHARKPQKQKGKDSTDSQRQRLHGTMESSSDQLACMKRLRERATPLLSQALGSTEISDKVAIAIVSAFSKVHDISLARRLLLDLNSALRRNPQLQSEVLAFGPEGAAKLAHQDPREWATDELHAKRRRWTEESIKEIKPSAPAAICPCCGGRAVIATGTAGSGRAGRTTKAFAHYTCLEASCGKSTHVKQD